MCQFQVTTEIYSCIVTFMNRSRKPQTIIFFLAFIALAISVYIVVAVKSHNAVYGCGNGSCHEILEGRWERWGPLSVATLGIGGYLALMAGSIFTTIPKFKRGHMTVWYLMAAEGLIGIGFIAWLMCLQWLVIKHFCIFCMLSHLFGVIAYLITIYKVPVWSHYRHTRLMVGGTASLALLFMIGVHVLVVPNIHATEDAKNIEYATTGNNSGGMIQFGKPIQESRTVHLLDDKLIFDLYKMPVLGSREAKHVILELSDYCCPSCRKLHFRMKQFHEIYDIDFAVVYLPAPMNSECNSNVKKTPRGFEDACTYAEFGMAVNKADSSKFETFHDFMMEGAKPPSVDAARKKAEEIVGIEEFESALKDSKIKEWIAAGVGAQHYIKAKTIPRIITKNQVISYSGGSKHGFANLMKRALGISELKKRK